MWADTRRVNVILASAFLLASLFATVVLLPETVTATTHYVGGGGPGNYTTIQTAIDDADPGDTIYVFSGTYYENLIVNKTLTFIGENRDTTIVDGGGISDAIRVISDDVSISGFTVRNGAEGWDGSGIFFYYLQDCHVEDVNLSSNEGAGLYLEQTQNCYVVDSIFTSNLEAGVHLRWSNNTTITGNIFLANGDGLWLQYSWDNNASHNNASGNSVGLSLEGSRRTTVTHNTFWNSTYGIWISGWDNVISYNTVMDSSSIGIEGYPFCNTRNIISHNVLSRNPLAMQFFMDDNLTLSHNVISHGKAGVELSSSENAIIDSNTITDHIFNGIHLADTPRATVMSNYLSRNDWIAILVRHSDHGTFVNNTLSDNGDGLIVGPYSQVIGNTFVGNNRGLSVAGSYSAIYHNNFVSNGEQVWYSNSGNQWDDGYPSGGNYWSNYNGTDNKSGPDQNQPGGDGIGDVPYIVDGRTNSEDTYPLMSPFIPSPVPPTAPKNLSAEEGYFNVTLSWEPPLFEGGFPVSYYKVYRRTLGNETVITVGNVLTYTDKGLVPDQWYYYRVSAVNAAGEGPTSVEVSAQPHRLPARRVTDEAAPGEDYLHNISVEWHVSTPGRGSAGSATGCSDPLARDASP